MTTTPEIPERRNIGQELADALGLNANTINSITIEPAGGGDLVVNVTSTMYLTGYADDDRADALIDTKQSTAATTHTDPPSLLRTDPDQDCPPLLSPPPEVEDRQRLGLVELSPTSFGVFPGMD